MGKLNTKFDFLVNLHKTNPQAFADYHEEMIEEYIQSLPKDRQIAAWQFQWNLTGELSKYKDPIARMNRMVELFWEQTYKFQDAMNALALKNENK